MAKGQRKEITETARDYTINLHKVCHGIQFKKRAPRAVREIARYAQKEIQTKDVRIDTILNRFIWSKGVRNIPSRVRVRMTRKKNDNEDSEEKFYTLVQHIQVDSFKSLMTEKAKI